MRRDKRVPPNQVDALLYSLSNVFFPIQPFIQAAEWKFRGVEKGNRWSVIYPLIADF